MQQPQDPQPTAPDVVIPDWGTDTRKVYGTNGAGERTTTVIEETTYRSGALAEKRVVETYAKHGFGVSVRTYYAIREAGATRKVRVSGAAYRDFCVATYEAQYAAEVAAETAAQAEAKAAQAAQLQALEEEARSRNAHPTYRRFQLVPPTPPAAVYPAGTLVRDVKHFDRGIHVSFHCPLHPVEGVYFSKDPYFSNWFPSRFGHACPDGCQAVVGDYVLQADYRPRPPQ